MGNRTIRVALLDDHEFILSALSVLTQQLVDEMTISHRDTDAGSFMSHVLADPPDVAVVDLMMAGRIQGHHVIERLTAADIPCIAFTAEQRRLPIRLAMQSGAKGLVLKSEPIEHLRDAIWDVAESGWAPSTGLAAAVLADSVHVPNLTPQELLCLRLASEGVPVKAIGRQFTPPISQSTVKTYMARAYDKYAAVGRRVANTTQAAVETASDGWFDI